MLFSCLTAANFALGMFRHQADYDACICELVCGRKEYPVGGLYFCVGNSLTWRHFSCVGRKCTQKPRREFSGSVVVVGGWQSSDCCFGRVRVLLLGVKSVSGSEKGGLEQENTGSQGGALWKAEV